jgi:EAL domain-containing protein (putative c-di-GMP-specific phosphodiesterase class I)/FixJ family two-component response regulator
MTTDNKMLVIEDDPDIGRLVSQIVEPLGWDCTVTASADLSQEALAMLPAVIFLDLVLPDIDGIQFLHQLSRFNSTSQIVLMSGVGQRVLETTEVLARTLGLVVVGTLQKPFAVEDVEAVLSKLRMVPIARRNHQRPDWDPDENDVKTGISNRQFILHYQPQISVATRSLVGVEALVRWMHPDRGLLLPGHFISRVEQLGLLDDMTWSLLSLSASEWPWLCRLSGLSPQLSLNVSVGCLHDLNFPDRIFAFLHSRGLRPDKVTLEVTESGLITDLKSTLEVMVRLRMRGIHLAIDDFGTAYAVMEHLRHIPATELKIDRSFVQNIEHSHSDRVVVQKTIEIGHALGMTVTAEGVEAPSQLDFLATHGCDVAQGFLFAKPMNAVDTLAWIESFGATRRYPHAT